MDLRDRLCLGRDPESFDRRVQPRGREDALIDRARDPHQPGGDLVGGPGEPFIFPRQFEDLRDERFRRSARFVDD